MIFLQLYVRMFLALSIALWGMVTITRLFYFDWMPRTDPCQQVEQVVLSTTIQAESIPLPTIPRGVRRVGLYRQQQKTPRHEDGQPPSQIPSGRLTKTTSISDDAPAALLRNHQSTKKVPAPTLHDERPPPSGRLTKKKPIRDDAPASLPRSHQSPKKVPPPSWRKELYKVDDDGHFVIVHRHNKLHVPVKDAAKRGDAAQTAFVDDDGHFVFGHQELPPPANNPPALTHRRLEGADVDSIDNDNGGKQMEEFDIQSSVFDDDGNFVFLHSESPMPYEYHPAESHLRPVGKVTNSRRIFTSEPEQDNDSMAMIGPTILVAVAAIVIVCAAILLLCDLRDRCRYNQHWKKQRPKQHQPQQQQRRGRNGGTSFPLDMIVTPGQKHHKKNPLSLSNDRNPSRHSIDAGEIDHEQTVVVDWIRYMMPSSPIFMEDDMPAQSPMMTSLEDTDEDHDVQLTSLHIPAPGEDPVETPSLDILTPSHAGLPEPLDKRVPGLKAQTAVMADHYAATEDKEEESQRALVPADDKVAVEVEPEEKRAISNPSPVKPKVMLSPAVASALSPTRSEISVLTEVSSDEEDTDDDDDEEDNDDEEHRIEVTTPSQQLVRGEHVLEEEVDATMSTAPSKKMFTLPPYMERSQDTLLEEERDVTHQLYPTAPNDDNGDDELRIVELSDQTDELSQVEQLLTSFIYHSEGEHGPLSLLRGEKDSCTTSASSDDDDEDFIRDIFYVPTASAQGTKDLSLQVIGASCPVTHPMIIFVGEESPLVGRLFVGDFVLRINEVEAGGMSSEDVLKFLVGSHIASRKEEGHVATTMGNKAVLSVKMIKLTVMSSHPDGSDTDASVDLGRPNTAAEV